MIGPGQALVLTLSCLSGLRADWVFDLPGDRTSRAESSPRFLAWNREAQELFVYDSARREIRVYSGEGVLIQAFLAEGLENTVSGMAVLSEGPVLLEAGSGRILRYDARGRLRSASLPRPEFSGLFTTAEGLGICDSSKQGLWLLPRGGKARFLKLPEPGLSGVVDVCESAGVFYLLDHDLGKISVVSAEGTLLRRFGARGGSPGSLSQPSGLISAGGGAVLVSDSMRHVVALFDKTGVFRAEFGAYGTVRGALRFPSDLEMIGARRFAVADSRNGRVCIFVLDIADNRTSK